tara:strand:- start:2749 stop:3237 length:489 start_codon:yes stop_codon:yes gene_type:complete
MTSPLLPPSLPYPLSLELVSDIIHCVILENIPLLSVETDIKHFNENKIPIHQEYLSYAFETLATAFIHGIEPLFRLNIVSELTEEQVSIWDKTLKLLAKYDTYSYFDNDGLSSEIRQGIIDSDIESIMNPITWIIEEYHNFDVDLFNMIHAIDELYYAEKRR